MWLFKKKQVEKFNISEESYDSLFIDIFDNVGTIIDTVCETNKLKVSSNSSNEIEIKNPSESTTTKNLKTLSTLIIDNDLIDTLIDKITTFFNVELYNHIITFIDPEKLKTINKTLEESDDNQDIQLDINTVIDSLKDKNYIGIFKKIREIILESDLSTDIKNIIQNTEQFNFILINTIKFLYDSNLSFTKEMFNSKKYTIDYLYEYDGSISKLTELIKSLIEEKEIITKCLKAFNIEKSTDITGALSESQNLLTEEDKDKDKSEGTLDIESQEIKENNTSTIKQILKSKQTYIIAGSIMTTIVSLCSAFYYYATYIGFEF